MPSFINDLKVQSFSQKKLSVMLTYFQLMFHFFIPWKHQGYDVFRGYRSGAMVENGLNSCVQFQTWLF